MTIPLRPIDYAGHVPDDDDGPSASYRAGYAAGLLAALLDSQQQITADLAALRAEVERITRLLAGESR